MIECGSATETKTKDPVSSGVGWSDVVMLGVAAAFSPLEIMADNVLFAAHQERVLALIALVWAVATLVVVLLVRRGVRPTTAVFSTFLVTSIIMRGGGLFRVFGQPTGWFGIVALLGVTIALIARNDRHRLVRGVFLALSVFLASGPLIALIEDVRGIGENIAIESGSPSLALTRRPDIFLIVLDGYVGLQTLDRDFGLRQFPILDALEGRGYEVPESAWSSYPSTRSSVPSLLDMSYPLQPGEGVTPATDLHLSKVHGGSNSLTAILEVGGYETVMIESGWSGSFCGPRIDRCVPAPVLDELMFSVASQTIAGRSVLETYGYSFTVGSQRTMSWLMEEGPRLSTDEVPTFVFAHLMAPHPPFFLDRDCRTAYSERRSGVFFSRASDDVDERRAAYLEQASCVNDFMIELSDQLDDDALVIFVADHGSDRRNQLVREPSSWTVADLIERYNVFLAVRDASGCSVGSPVIIPNIFRRLLSCMSDQTLPDLEPRMMKYAAISFDGEASPIVEVERDDVLALLGS